jgi:hypothetical protein
MLLCYFSKDKNFKEDGFIQIDTNENLQNLLCQKHIMSIVDLFEIFNKCTKKISLIEHFAKNTNEQELIDISKIISQMMDQSYNYAMFQKL